MVEFNLVLILALVVLGWTMLKVTQFAVRALLTIIIIAVLALLAASSGLLPIS